MINDKKTEASDEVQKDPNQLDIFKQGESNLKFIKSQKSNLQKVLKQSNPRSYKKIRSNKKYLGTLIKIFHITFYTNQYISYP